MSGLNPADYLLGFLGKGPANRMALIGCLMGRGYPYAVAEIECGQAILALVKAGRIESFQGDIWRLSSATKTESDPDPDPKTIPPKANSKARGVEHSTWGANGDGSGQ